MSKTKNSVRTKVVEITISGRVPADVSPTRLGRVMKTVLLRGIESVMNDTDNKEAREVVEAATLNNPRVRERDTKPSNAQ